MKRWLCNLLLQVVALLSLAACDRSSTPAAGAPARDVEQPRRIVSLAPSVTETLFALGAGSRLVGVTRFCDYPSEAASLPKIGGLTDVDVEIVLSLKPDLVVGVSSKTASGLARTLKIAGVETLFLPVETFADVQGSMRTLGQRVGAPAEGERLAASIASHDAPPAAEPPRVLVLFGRDPWIAAGPNTFADEMIRRAGGTNAVADLDAPYPTLDAERLGVVSADVVIDTSWGDDAPIPLANPTTVTRLDPGLIRPGPRLVEAMAQFRAAIVAAEKP